MRGLLTIATAVLVAACGGDIGGPTGPDIGTPNPSTGQQFVGVYRLQSINGNSLSVPYVQHWLGQDTYGKQYVTDGRIEFHPNGEYKLFLNKALRIGTGPLVYGPLERSGSWTFEPAQAGDVSGPIRLHHASGDHVIQATPYTVTDDRNLDPFKTGTERLIYVKE